MTFKEGDLNTVLHKLLGVWTPCVTACTHRIAGEWTALGLANVAARTETEKWELWRQDDNGNRFQMGQYHGYGEADGWRNWYEKKGHKQFYWVQPATGRLSDGK